MLWPRPMDTPSPWGCVGVTPHRRFQRCRGATGCLGRLPDDERQRISSQDASTINDVHIEIEGDRRAEPPGIVQIRYRLILDSPEPPEELAKLHDLAFKWGTITNTLLHGVSLQGTWEQK